MRLVAKRSGDVRLEFRAVDSDATLWASADWLHLDAGDTYRTPHAAG